MSNLIKFVSNRHWLTKESLSAPGPIIRTIPEWYRKADRFAKKPNGDFWQGPDQGKIPTWKACPAIFDIMGTGYTLKTPCDIEFSHVDKNTLSITISDGRYKDFCTPRQPMEQFEHPRGYYQSHFAWFPDWAVETPEGYSALYTQPFNRFELPFLTTSGIVDNDNVNLPGLTIETTQAKTFGEIREMPYQKMFDNINMGFYVDNAMSVKLLFDAWMEAIQDPVTRTFNYYKDYTTDITVEVFDIANKVRYIVTLFQCYPKMINPVQMDYAGKDVMKLLVSMNYKYWQSFAATSSGSAPSLSSTSFGSGLLNGGLIGDSLRVPDTYFTNFDTFQTGFNSFEQGRASLFSSETASVGQGSILI
jgi:hypothetical protein